MNKTILVITAALCVAGVAYGAKLVLDDQDATKVGLPSLVTKVNANFTELYNGSAMSDVTVINATLTGKLKVTGTISNTTLTASLPVFTDDNKVLVSGTTGLATTNATVGGGVLSGVGVVVTNATVAGAVLSGVSVVITNATVSGAALSGVGVVITNVASATTIIAATNGTIAVTLSVVSNSFTYLDGSSNTVTNYFVTAVSVESATFTPQTANAIATLTVESGTPVVSAPSITLQTGTAVVSAPSITLQTGTPAVSAPTITLQTGTFAKP